MTLPGHAFSTTTWADVDPSIHAGITGEAVWRSQQIGDTRLRMVEYSPGYLADHWCTRGHVLFVIEGSLDTELEDGRRFTLHPGESYQVGTDMEPHRSSTATGARLFVVD